MRLPGFELPEAIWQAQGEFDDELAKRLDGMADRFEGKPAGAGESAAFEARFRHLEQTIQMFGLRDLQKEVPMQLDTFLTLSRRAEQLTTSLNGEI